MGAQYPLDSVKNTKKKKKNREKGVKIGKKSKKWEEMQKSFFHFTSDRAGYANEYLQL